jgi:hypothetical protein
MVTEPARERRIDSGLLGPHRLAVTLCSGSFTWRKHLLTAHSGNRAMYLR